MPKTTEKPATPATGRGKGGKNRRADILRAAGTLMAAKGYDATSMRDISASVGMLPGSVYYHFPSKEALFVELHKDVVQAMTARVREAVEGVSDPWERLRLSARAHLEGLTQNDNLVAIVSPQFIRDQTEVAKVVTDHRREYEQIFRDIFAALDLPEGTDATILRLGLFGSLNWVPVWYEPDGPRQPAEISDQFVAVLKNAYAPRDSGQN
ncbi:TetR/AcrR family transcriptional regulator [Arenibacterium halophilum]|uniref:TetR/AcrR family transcriptional regulator n=1 Tax=Arenibacterium halophilum TaxID=2583821 RepID=A0ABY2XCK0_9RHOB|nr:TetR/AcrR family transcriptional regulator [Arenibacterium halophilum]TMV13674.1 TetR/AcrR family transcriptional regulator [Arenibacterium halophilum]